MKDQIEIQLQESQLVDKLSAESSSSKKSDYEEDSFEDDSIEELEDRSTPEMEADIVEQTEVISEKIIQDATDLEEKEPTTVDDEEETSTIELGITSDTPTSFNSDDHAFHLNFIREPMSKSAMRNRTSNRISYSFTNDRMREIDRHNRILLQRILTKKPTYENPFAKKPQQIFSKNIAQASRTSSAAINRKKVQMQIDRENQILKRKIEAISCRRTKQLS